jgi:aryl-alcohol dehydrogenase-like predicted oxidoreductase
MANDDWRERDQRFQEPRLPQNLELIDRLTGVADRRDTIPGAVAVAWTLRNTAVDGAIVGFRRPIRSTPSSSLPISSSVTRTQPKSKGAHDES